MSRRNRPSKRRIEPDVKYNNEHVTMCVNRLMRWGKRSVAQSILYDAFDMVGERMSRDPLAIFDQAIKNATPLIEVKPRRVGGATYQVPVEVAPDRRISLALRWLLAAAQGRSGKNMAEKLAAELMDAANNVGATIKRREDTHRMAEANKAYAFYRW